MKIQDSKTVGGAVSRKRERLKRAFGWGLAVSVLGFAPLTQAQDPVTPQPAASQGPVVPAKVGPRNPRWARAERLHAFASAWAEGSEENKDWVRAEILRYRKTRPTALDHIDIPQVVRWTNRLRGAAVPKDPTPLEAWASKVEIRLQPGWSSPDPEGCEVGSEQVVVWVQGRGRPPGLMGANGWSHLALDWVSPSGERKRARSERVHGTNWDGKPFPMYLFAPEPHNLTGKDVSFWTLQPTFFPGEDLLAAKQAVGHGVPFAAGVSPEPKVLPTGARAAARKALQTGGVRSLEWGPYADLVMGSTVAWAASEWRGVPYAVWEPRPADRATGEIWVVLEGGDLPQSLFFGEQSSQWAPLVGLGWRVVVHTVPIFGSGTGPDAGGPDLTAAIQEQATGAPLILVVGGQQARSLGLRMRQGPLPVPVSVAAIQARKREANLPGGFQGAQKTLILLPADPWEAPKNGPELHFVATPDPAIVVRQNLAQLVPWTWLFPEPLPKGKQKD